MSRPREFDADTALHQCMEVFWEKGFHATSYEDLTRSTQVKKQSLYGAFKNKRQLFLQSLRVYRQQVLEELERRVASAKTPAAKLEAICEATMQESGEKARRGCLIINSSLEFGDADEEVAQEVRTMLIRLEEMIEQVVRSGQEQGTITRQIGSRALAAHLNNALGGAKIMEKSGASREEIAAVLHTAVALMRTI